jgi:hypothetical protein
MKMLAQGMLIKREVKINSNRKEKTIRRRKVCVYLNIEPKEKKPADDDEGWSIVGEKKEKTNNKQEQNKKLKEEINNYLQQF